MPDLGTIGQKGNLVLSKPDQSAAATSKWSFNNAWKGNLAKERPDQSASFTSEWTFSDAWKGHLVFPKAQSAGTESAWDLIGGQRGNLAWGATPPILAFIAQKGNLVFNRLELSPAAIPNYLNVTAQKGLLVYGKLVLVGKSKQVFNFMHDHNLVDDEDDFVSVPSYGVLLRDEVSLDTPEMLLASDDPVLETGDQHYSNLNAEKETDAVMPNASWTHGDSLKVQVHGRQYLSDVVNFNEPDATVGNWTPNLEEGKLTFTNKKRYGRVLRYRFIGVGLRFLRFDAYAVNVYMRGAER